MAAELFRARAVECSSCGHLDAHMVRYCSVCGRGTQELEDVCEAIVPAAIRRDVELVYVNDEPEFDQRRRHRRPVTLPGRPKKRRSSYGFLGCLDVLLDFLQKFLATDLHGSSRIKSGKLNPWRSA